MDSGTVNRQTVRHRDLSADILILVSRSNQLAISLPVVRTKCQCSDYEVSSTLGFYLPLYLPILDFHFSLLACLWLATKHSWNDHKCFLSR